jgi:hypothetical protein
LTGSATRIFYIERASCPFYAAVSEHADQAKFMPVFKMKHAETTPFQNMLRHSIALVPSPAFVPDSPIFFLYFSRYF